LGELDEDDDEEEDLLSNIKNSFKEFKEIFSLINLTRKLNNIELNRLKTSLNNFQQLLVRIFPTKLTPYMHVVTHLTNFIENKNHHVEIIGVLSTQHSELKHKFNKNSFSHSAKYGGKIKEKEKEDEYLFRIKKNFIQRMEKEILINHMKFKVEIDNINLAKCCSLCFETGHNKRTCTFNFND